MKTHWKVLIAIAAVVFGIPLLVGIMVFVLQLSTRIAHGSIFAANGFADFFGDFFATSIPAIFLLLLAFYLGATLIMALLRYSIPRCGGDGERKKFWPCCVEALKAYKRNNNIAWYVLVTIAIISTIVAVSTYDTPVIGRVWDHFSTGIKGSAVGGVFEETHYLLYGNPPDKKDSAESKDEKSPGALLVKNPEPPPAPKNHFWPTLAWWTVILSIVSIPFVFADEVIAFFKGAFKHFMKAYNQAKKDRAAQQPVLTSTSTTTGTAPAGQSTAPAAVPLRSDPLFSRSWIQMLITAIGGEILGEALWKAIFKGMSDAVTAHRRKWVNV